MLQVEETETEALCRALIDRAFPELIDDATHGEHMVRLREQLAVLESEMQASLRA